MTRVDEIRERLENAPMIVAKYGTDGKLSYYHDYIRDVEYLLKRVERFEHASYHALSELHPMRMPYTYVMQALKEDSE